MVFRLRAHMPGPESLSLVAFSMASMLKIRPLLCFHDHASSVFWYLPKGKGGPRWRHRVSGGRACVCVCVCLFVCVCVA